MNVRRSASALAAGITVTVIAAAPAVAGFVLVARNRKRGQRQ